MNMKTSNAAINWQLWSSNAFARYLRDLRDGRDLDRNTNCDNPCRTTFCYVTGKMHDFPLDWLAQSSCLVSIHHCRSTTLRSGMLLQPVTNLSNMFHCLVMIVRTWRSGARLIFALRLIECILTSRMTYVRILIWAACALVFSLADDLALQQ